MSSILTLHIGTTDNGININIASGVTNFTIALTSKSCVRIMNIELGENLNIGGGKGGGGGREYNAKSPVLECPRYIQAYLRAEAVRKR